MFGCEPLRELEALGFWATEEAVVCRLVRGSAGREAKWLRACIEPFLGDSFGIGCAGCSAFSARESGMLGVSSVSQGAMLAPINPPVLSFRP